MNPVKSRRAVYVRSSGAVVCAVVVGLMNNSNQRKGTFQQVMVRRQWSILGAKK